MNRRHFKITYLLTAQEPARGLVLIQLVSAGESTVHCHVLTGRFTGAAWTGRCVARRSLGTRRVSGRRRHRVSRGRQQRLVTDFGHGDRSQRPHGQAASHVSTRNSLASVGYGQVWLLCHAMAVTLYYGHTASTTNWME